MTVTKATAGRIEVDQRATALSAFRALPNGAGRQYSVVEAPSGYDAVELSIRRFNAFGFIGGTSEDCYAVLDVLDENDDIIQDFHIPNARAFRYIKQVLGLRVESTDGDR